jgi:hypothetical protein
MERGYIMVQIKTRYGEVRDGTWEEFWTEHNFILMHGFQTKPQQQVAHAKEDHSFAAAQRRIAKEMGEGFMREWGGPDNRPLEQKIASEVARQLGPQAQPTPVQHSQPARSTPEVITLADAQRRLREAGVSWSGVVVPQPATQRGQAVHQAAVQHNEQVQTVHHSAEIVHGPNMHTCQIVK